ncbi:hypothetical protein BDV96DRAFT_642273 [Lophiotrema nucula]|uniref:P-loop containing nucleoside triphosphate hydrolase protein n=1 Tax=Lophiotrema nucula TaxID=690887 RepID=A0A6A5ZJC8_9PLEO|nr:hypothetical protein BDV96DRAFT_642273 [Lophiotrema nucula]
MDGSSEPLHNILFTQPRTASHLLTKILNLDAQPSIHPHSDKGYFFLKALGVRFRHDLSGKHIDMWSAQENEDYRAALQGSYTEFENWLEEVENTGKGSYVKQHTSWLIEPVSETKFIYGRDSTNAKTWAINVDSRDEVEHSKGNETILPSTTLLRLRPTFLIRHPALAFPSLLRTSIDNEGFEKVLNDEGTQKWEMTLHWTRSLYSWYLTHLSNLEKATKDEVITYPIILDADDISKSALMAKYAAAVGLDPSLIRFEWEAASPEELKGLSKTVQRMKDTILASTKIVEGKDSRALILGDEKQKWKDEFGEVLAGRLVKFVDGAMDDYEWLKERRLKG